MKTFCLSSLFFIMPSSVQFAALSSTTGRDFENFHKVFLDVNLS